MYPEFYEQISAIYRKDPKSVRVLATLDKVLVAVVAASYVAMLVWLAVIGDARFWTELLVPAVSFAAMSIARAAINAPRPYEAYAIDPLIKKDTKGKSFPGRHVFSAAVIACAFLNVNVAWGISGFTAMALIAYVRVVGGVHFPRDVIAGAALGALCGVVGFWLF